VAELQQAVHEVAADEAGRASDEIVHSVCVRNGPVGGKRRDGKRRSCQSELMWIPWPAMARSSARGGLPHDFWPTPQQRLLLRAALEDGETAKDAWQAWRASVDLLQADPGSRRLLPLVYHNLRQHLAGDPAEPTLRAHYRRGALKNQAAMQEMGGLLAELHRAGVPTLVLKGAALATRYYPAPGARPMDDIDVLVPTAEAERAIERLKALGWTPALLRIHPKHQFTARQATPMRSQHGRVFDLHWHVLRESCHTQADDAFWAHAVPIEIGRTVTRALGPADQLLHVCVHGARWAPLPPVRWVTDAMLVMRRANQNIDWDHLLGQARRLRVTLPMRDTLAFLRQHFVAAVPPEVLVALAASPTARIDRQFYRLKSKPPGLLGVLPLAYYHYLVLAAGAEERATLGGFWRHLQATWDLDRPAGVLGAAARKALRRIGWKGDEQTGAGLMQIKNRCRQRPPRLSR
jgi:hypothetical protein